MLQSLHISNYALIDSMEIDLVNGFNVITGETGAGKSIMLGALSLILGGRSDAKVIRDTNRKSVIEAVFSVEGDDNLRNLFIREQLDWDSKVCILRREVSAATGGGRSRAFVNDSPVSLSQLQTIAQHLVDIHSQHHNLLLSKPDFQLEIVDAIASNQAIRQEYSAKFQTFRDAVRTLKKAQARIETARRDQEYLRFQLSQLDQLNPQIGEDIELERERELLSNLGDIKVSISLAITAMSNDNGEPDLMSRLSEIRTHINRLQPALNPDDRIAERLEATEIELKDIMASLENIDESLNTDPHRLTYVEDRLNKIYELESKHKVESVDQLVELRDTLRASMSDIDNADELVSKLRKKALIAREEAIKAANQLTETRGKAAADLTSLLQERARPLGMGNLQVKIPVEPDSLSATGADKVEFRFAFNKNQTPQPAASGASGGEISRLMLALKSIVADSMRLPSMIFDEIDTGVSGDVANRMGQMMQSMASAMQVIAITHLPQVAAKGEAHFKVYKFDNEQSTLSAIRCLTPDERIKELALMLSGDAANPAAQATARSLLNL